MSDEILNEIVDIPQRKNPFCVISKNTFGGNNLRDIQTNSAWSKNPYEDYAVVPDDMVPDIQETNGYCDIALNEDETEVVSFLALDKPQRLDDYSEPTQLDLIEAQVMYTAMMTDTLL